MSNSHASFFRKISLCFILCFACFCIAVAELPPVVSGQKVPSLAPMLKRVLPCVVNIVAMGHDNHPEKLSRYKHLHEKEETMSNGKPIDNFVSIGSGVIINAKKGYIVTNNHVIHNTNNITVNLSDGRRFEAKIIGKDALSDIAVLQIHADNLHQIKFADSNHLQVGDFVAAIGNPFGLNQTVTSGIVSALGRSSLRLEGPTAYENFIQTDAPINPGNSGGALVNLDGQLEGINTAILARDGGNIGIGFAIPVNMVKEVIRQLVRYGSMHRGRVGIMVQKMTPELAKAFQRPFHDGTVITQTAPHTPAAQAGLKPGDIIRTVNGVEAKNPDIVRNTIGLLRAGSKVTLQILRDNKVIEVELHTIPEKKLVERVHRSDRFLFGMAFKDFDQEMPGLGHLRGVEVLHIEPNTPAWNAHLIPGDIITDINQHPITTIAALQKYARTNKDDTILLRIVREPGAALFVVIKGFHTNR